MPPHLALPVPPISPPAYSYMVLLASCTPLTPLPPPPPPLLATVRDPNIWRGRGASEIPRSSWLRVPSSNTYLAAQSAMPRSDCSGCKFLRRLRSTRPVMGDGKVLPAVLNVARMYDGAALRGRIFFGLLSIFLVKVENRGRYVRY